MLCYEGLLSSASQSKNAVCAVQINFKYKPLFPLEKSGRNEQMTNFILIQKAVSDVSTMCRYYVSGLKWNVRLTEVSAMLDKCTYCVFNIYGRIPHTGSFFNLRCLLFLFVCCFFCFVLFLFFVLFCFVFVLFCVVQFLGAILSRYYCRYSCWKYIIFTLQIWLC